MLILHDAVFSVDRFSSSEEWKKVELDGRRLLLSKLADALNVVHKELLPHSKFRAGALGLPFFNTDPETLARASEADLHAAIRARLEACTIVFTQGELDLDLQAIESVQQISTMMFKFMARVRFVECKFEEAAIYMSPICDFLDALRGLEFRRRNELSPSTC